MYFVSPSGNGYKVVYRFSEKITDNQHYKENYIHYAEQFENDYNVDADGSTKDASHACFFSHDPNLYLNENAEMLEVLDISETTKKSKKKKIKKVKSKENSVKVNDSEPITKNDKIHLATAVKPKEEGNRHWSLITAVGHFISLGMNDKTIISLALALNNQNTPPKPKEEITKIVKKLIEKSEHLEGDFWTINRANIKIHTTKFIDFLSTKGFAKVYYDKSYIYVRVESNIADEIIITNIKDYVNEYIISLNGDMTNYKEQIREIILDKVNKYFSDSLLATMKPETLNMNNGNRDTRYIYFKNGYVVGKKNEELQLNSYQKLDKPIWESSIIEREFNHNPIKYNQSEYESFLWNVARKDENRFLAICSAIGYLLHGYKDKSTARAIITVDEKVSENPDGGSGKSLFGNAISQIKKSVRIDSKNFEFKPSFTFQQVDISSEIVEFNDAEKNFKFEKLFSVITDDMNIEYKGKTPIRIPFEESPKILISTNYTIAGLGGSYDRRMFELEFSDHYNASHTPIDEFGHNFFEDWEDEEWNNFDNFMLECLMLYLDEGLIAYKKVNLDRRKLLDRTNPDFIDFMETSFNYGAEYDRKTLFVRFKESIGYDNDFMNECPVKINTFTKWIKYYAEHTGKIYKERPSNGLTYIKILN
ncbi:MAG: hypothetical protein GY936_16580 [Ignavibacteriae bacterium]|nr:hypothetical protein [Ignavibacteriota bacterium]